MRESWTDERMDDLSHRVDEGFRRVDADIRDLRTEMNDRFDKVDARFEAMQCLMLQSSVLAIVALIGLIATQL